MEKENYRFNDEMLEFRFIICRYFFVVCKFLKLDINKFCLYLG